MKGSIINNSETNDQVDMLMFYIKQVLITINIK